MNETFSLVSIAQYSAEAQIIKGRLEAEGIHVYLRDNVTIDTDPLVSNAIGGVKLYVDSENAVNAKAVLNSIGEYSLKDNGEPIICPSCNSSKIDYFSTINSIKSLLSFIVGFIFGTLPFYTKYEYRCEACKNKFNLK